MFERHSNAVLGVIAAEGDERAAYELKIREGQGMIVERIFQEQTGYDGDHMEPIPGLEIRTILEGMTPEQLKEEKQRLLDEMSEREKMVWLINDVIEGTEDNWEPVERLGYGRRVNCRE